MRTPETSETVRVETGVKQNDDVLVHYDPMIAKLVVWGSDRDEALRILRSKLCEYNVSWRILGEKYYNGYKKYYRYVILRMICFVGNRT